MPDWFCRQAGTVRSEYSLNSRVELLFCIMSVCLHLMYCICSSIYSRKDCHHSTHKTDVLTELSHVVCKYKLGCRERGWVPDIGNVNKCDLMSWRAVLATVGRLSFFAVFVHVALRVVHVLDPPSCSPSLHLYTCALYVLVPHWRLLFLSKTSFLKLS